MKKPKAKYAVMLHGRLLGETWAVSEKKAICNVWWSVLKEKDQFTISDYSIDDLDVIKL